MNQLSNASNYLDISGIQQLKAKAGANPDDQEALKTAAEHFESIFINMMMKSMRKANAVFEEGNPMHSNTTKFFRDMYDQQLATDMASKGSLGLSDLIVQQLSNDPADYQSASTLRNDGGFERTNFNNSAKPTDIMADKLGAFAGNPLFASQFGNANANAGDISDSYKQMVDGAFGHVGLTVNSDHTSPQATQQLAQQQSLGAETPSQYKPNVAFESPKDFVSQIWDYAKKAASKIGVNPTVMVAQSALETGWGKYIIEDKNGGSSFNLFNVKAHRDWQGEKAVQSTLEFENGLPVKKVEPFRVYNNFSESFDDFVGFLKGNDRYQDALNNASDTEQFLQGLQNAGYATDPKYAEKIIGILKSDSFKTMVGDVNTHSPIK